MARSIEEEIEDWAKGFFPKGKYFTKTAGINPEIDEALKKAPSKSGGSGNNYPDIKYMMQTPKGDYMPVMIEVKGSKGVLIKLNQDTNTPENTTKKGEPAYQNISRFAVNGAVHYANAILKYTKSYNEVVAIGVNGYKDDANIIRHEVSVWYVSKDNLFIPKEVGHFEDLSFLNPEHKNDFFERITHIGLTDKEIEQEKAKLEDDIERRLKSPNQKMHDELKIVVNQRVQLVTGLIMAGLGVIEDDEIKVKPLQEEELQGNTDEENNDGAIIMRKIKLYLKYKKLPTEKIDMIVKVLSVVFLHSKLDTPINGESHLKTLYRDIQTEILPFLSGELHNIDFTGRLFNVLNEWVDVPDGDENDVVLTPRYVTELMAKFCQVNKDSYVWDFAAGSAGFLISSMHQMIADAKATIDSPQELQKKINHIKMEQLLGIEKLPDIYLLAVLNMILMKDGSANIIHANSLTEFQGQYEQGEHKGENFPANVFLLNPPYSASGKGFVFVEKALSMMHRGGRAAVLIQENAGSGKGMPYTKNILQNNTLLASIKMSDIFFGKAGVQTGIYVFEVGKPHNVQSVVKFIDFSEDGYTRQNRKKSGQSVNLRDTDNAKERYDEVARLVNYGRGINNENLNYFRECYVEDHITLKGNDWTYSQHIKIDTIPNPTDFTKVVKDYLDWKVSEKSKQNDDSRKISCDHIDETTELFFKNGGSFKRKKAKDLFCIKANPQLNKESFTFGEKSQYPYFTRTVLNNGVLGYVDYLDEEHLIKGNSLAVGMMGMQFFYMKHDFYAGQFTKTAFPLFDGFNEKVALWFISWFNKSSKKYLGLLVRDFEEAFYETELDIPYYGDKIALDYMEKRVCELEKEHIKEIENDRICELKAYLEVAGLTSKDCNIILP
ncbi:MAG: N-6 DNA methylase [Salinivirgaceae bacterium]|nr:N-6 DNA methylase [Salinivirgaceae bacterium]